MKASARRKAYHTPQHDEKNPKSKNSTVADSTAKNAACVTEGKPNPACLNTGLWKMTTSVIEQKWLPEDYPPHTKKNKQTNKQTNKQKTRKWLDRPRVIPQPCPKMVDFASKPPKKGRPHRHTPQKGGFHTNATKKADQPQPCFNKAATRASRFNRLGARTALRAPHQPPGEQAGG